MKRATHERLLLGMVLLCTLALPGAVLAGGIAGTVHNLSTGGPGPVKSVTEDQVCIFCHTPHNAQPSTPLWNHSAGAGTYAVYTSESLQASIGQPSGDSKLCLTCHDGTVALGSLFNRGGALMTNGGLPSAAQTISGANLIGTDLTDSHPFSFTPVVGGEIKRPEAGDAVKLDSHGQVQCTSCHDPHDNTYGKFLVKANDDPVNGGGQICKSCHLKTAWASSIHATSTTLINGTAMKTKGCSACHRMHHPDVHKRLYTNGRGTQNEEDNCYQCHDGATASKDIRQSFGGGAVVVSAHPVAATSGGHWPGESYQYGNVNKPARHSECLDCHDPHQVQRNTGTTRPGLFPELTGASGVEPSYASTSWGGVNSYTPLASAATEYQICFKCHSNYAWGTAAPSAPSEETRSQTNVAADFNPNNNSGHLVIPGSVSKMAPAVSFPGGFINGYTQSTILYCDDCHADSNQATFNGPHGSGQKFILKARYTSSTGLTGTFNDLCFRCHDYQYYSGNSDGPTSSVLSNRSQFSDGSQTNLHRISNHAGKMACMRCHAALPHGWKRLGLLVDQSDPAPWNGGSQVHIYVSDPGFAGNWNAVNACGHTSGTTCGG